MGRMLNAAAADAALIPDLEALAAADRAFAAAFARCGPPPRRWAPRGFAGLARIVAGQQLSIHAAAAVAGRLAAAGYDAPPAAARAATEDLRRVGLSAAKARALQALAQATVDGRFDFDALDAADDATAAAMITAQPGLGRWSAEIYLLFALRRPDVWPAGDLAIRKALGRLRAASQAPDQKTTDLWGDAFRPRRSAAAQFLWHYLKHPVISGL